MYKLKSMSKIFVRTFFILSLLCLPAKLSASDDELELLSGSSPHLQFGAPSDPDQLLSRVGFALGYSNKYRQPLWVSYVLRTENLTGKKLRRRSKFEIDPAVRYYPVTPADYIRTGFDRGHMAPAADMSFAIVPLRHSFFMSNISPQIPGCNRGIWKRLEMQTRWYVLRRGDVHIVTGPVFSNNFTTTKKSNLPIPVAFYKVLFDSSSHKMIGFVIPNTPSKKQLDKFAVTVDEVERITGLDFFNSLEDHLENQLESRFDYDLWFNK